MPAELTLAVDADGVATLTLNRPEVHNALSGALIEGLTAAAKRLDADPAVRVVVLTGAGASFCAGADLGWMRATMTKSRAERLKDSGAIGTMLEALDRLSKPVIARVNGQAYAGGVGLVAVADVAIAVATAKFALTETRLGLVPANIGPFVLARVGAAKARRHFLNSRVFDAAEAREMGLVDVVVSPEELDAAVAREVKLFLDCAPGAVAATKRLFAHLPEVPLAVARAYAAEALADAWEGSEAKAGIAGFLDKTPPPWRRKRG